MCEVDNLIARLCALFNYQLHISQKIKRVGKKAAIKPFFSLCNSIGQSPFLALWVSDRAYEAKSGLCSHNSNRNPDLRSNQVKRFFQTPREHKALCESGENELPTLAPPLMSAVCFQDKDGTRRCSHRLPSSI
jgi:hypothetical protein